LALHSFCPRATSSPEVYNCLFASEPLLLASSFLSSADDLPFGLFGVTHVCRAVVSVESVLNFRVPHGHSGVSPKTILSLDVNSVLTQSLLASLGTSFVPV